MVDRCRDCVVDRCLPINRGQAVDVAVTVQWPCCDRAKTALRPCCGRDVAVLMLCCDCAVTVLWMCCDFTVPSLATGRRGDRRDPAVDGAGDGDALQQRDRQHQPGDRDCDRLPRQGRALYARHGLGLGLGLGFVEFWDHVSCGFHSQLCRASQPPRGVVWSR